MPRLKIPGFRSKAERGSSLAAYAAFAELEALPKECRDALKKAQIEAVLASEHYELTLCVLSHAFKDSVELRRVLRRSIRALREPPKDSISSASPSASAPAKVGESSENNSTGNKHGPRHRGGSATHRPRLEHTDSESLLGSTAALTDSIGEAEHPADQEADEHHQGPLGPSFSSPSNLHAAASPCKSTQRNARAEVPSTSSVHSETSKGCTDLGVPSDQKTKMTKKKKKKKKKKTENATQVLSSKSLDPAPAAESAADLAACKSSRSSPSVKSVRDETTTNATTSSSSSNNSSSHHQKKRSHTNSTQKANRKKEHITSSSALRHSTSIVEDHVPVSAYPTGKRVPHGVRHRSAQGVCDRNKSGAASRKTNLKLSQEEALGISVQKTAGGSDMEDFGKMVCSTSMPAISSSVGKGKKNSLVNVLSADHVRAHSSSMSEAVSETGLRAQVVAQRSTVSDRADASSPANAYHSTSHSEHSIEMQRLIEEVESGFIHEDPKPLFTNMRTVGRGSFGDVYTCRRINEEKGAKRLAVKHFREGFDVPSSKKMIVTEISTLAACQHPNIVSYIESYYHRGEVWLVMNYCDGGTLLHLIQGSRISSSNVANIFKQLLPGVAYLHRQGFVHRDIKAANVLLDVEGTVRLGDLGLCVPLRSEALSVSTAGSRYWMAPEVVRIQPYDEKVDMWALGGTLHECLCQGVPMYGKLRSLKAMMMVCVQGAQPLPKRYPEPVRDFYASLTRSDPAQRASAEDLLDHPFLDRACSTNKLVSLLEVVFLSNALTLNGF
eukprot:CAMPEP_0174229864 /NCGR_PEP_ID=MMETSP0417-20130205/745_1 /TAXON_ID=242541 /ORGANISM="Mayorella sp, Strain BSH-02190019" /LENGTH=781 /DNA_ID=CAMNT_0015307463 /DNA_START=107 /DNA_END=2452 /DNA_ORIENTATION=+